MRPLIVLFVLFGASLFASAAEAGGVRIRRETVVVRDRRPTAQIIRVPVRQSFRVSRGIAQFAVPGDRFSHRRETVILGLDSCGCR